jgi:hypothetical protein
MVHNVNYTPPMRQQPPRECRRTTDIRNYRNNAFKDQYNAQDGPSNFTRPGWPSNESGYMSSDVGSLAVAPSRSPSPAPSSQSFSTTSSEASVHALLFPKYPKSPIVADPSWEIPPTGHFSRMNPRYAHMLTSLGRPQGYEDLPRPTGSETSTEIIGGGSIYGSSRSTIHRATSILSEEDVNNQIEEDRRRTMNGRLFATARAAGASTEYAYFGKMMVEQQRSRSLWSKAGLQIEKMTTFFEIIWAEFSFKKIYSPWVFSRVEFLLLIIVGVMIAQSILSYFK